MQDTMAQELEEALAYPCVQLDTDTRISQVTFPDNSQLNAIRVNLDATGLAEIHYEDGAVYQGEVAEASPNGIGVYETAGATVMGNFSEQTLQGTGVLRYSNGSVVSGSFRAGQVEDYGTAYDADAQLYYAGQFRLNRADGIGALVLGEFQKIFYGEFNHQIYYGYFQDGAPQGRGIAFSAETKQVIRFNRYEGYFSSGLRDGPGALFLANGDTLIGQFQQNVKNGLFVYVSQQGSLELRFYENDIVKRSYAPENLYVPRPYMLRCLCFEVFTLETFDKYVKCFKSLAAGEIPEDKIPIMQVLYNECKQLTAPLYIGVCEDLRVCQPYMSEAILEAARMQTGAEQLDKPLRDAVEELKSAVINNYDAINFLFNAYRARDRALVRRRRDFQYADPVAELVEQFAQICRAVDAQIADEQAQEALRIQQELEKAQESKEEAEEQEEQEEPKPSTTNEETMTRQASERSLSRPDVELGAGREHSAGEGDQKGSENDSTGGAGPFGAAQFAEAARQFHVETSHLPKGAGPRDNELVHAVVAALDHQQQVSLQSVRQLCSDMASALGLQHRFYQSQPYLEHVLRECSVPADGFLLQQQFGIAQPFCASERVFGVLNFAALLVASAPAFGYENPSRFVQDAVVGYAKKLMARLEAILEGDQEQLDQFIETMSVRKTLSQSLSRRRTATPAAQGETPSRNNESLRSTHRSNANLQSIPRSLASNASRSPGSRAPPQPIPRVLVRDMTFQLDEVEQAIMRTADLQEKLLGLYRTRDEYQRDTLYRCAICEDLEALITAHCGPEVALFDFQAIGCRTVLQFMQRAFNAAAHELGAPRFDDDPQFYANALVPYYMRFTDWDVYGALQRVAKESADPAVEVTGLRSIREDEEPRSPARDANASPPGELLPPPAPKQSQPGVLDGDVPLVHLYRLTGSTPINAQHLIALVACVLLRTDVAYQKQQRQTPDVPADSTSEVNSEEMAASVRSDNSLYSKNQSFLEQQAAQAAASRREEETARAFAPRGPLSPAAVRAAAGEFLAAARRCAE